MLDKLPTEILFKIFDNLPKTSLANLLTLSKRIRDIIFDKYHIIEELRDLGRQDPFLARKWELEHNFVVGEVKSLEILSNDELCFLSYLYQDVVTKLPNSFTEKYNSVEERSLHGHGISEVWKTTQLFIFEDKIVIDTNDCLKILSIDAKKLLKRIQLHCRQGGVLRSGDSLLIPDPEMFKVLNLETLKVTSLPINYRNMDITDVEVFDHGFSSKAIAIVTHRNAYIWSRDCLNVIIMPVIDVCWMNMNEDFIVVRHKFSQSAFQKLQFHSNGNEDKRRKLSKNVWIDEAFSSLTCLSSSSNASPLYLDQDILLGDNNLLAFKEKTYIHIVDVMRDAILFRVKNVMEDGRRAFRHKDLVQWQGHRLYYSGINIPMGYINVQTQSEHCIESIKGVAMIDSKVWFGLAHIALLKFTPHYPGRPAKVSFICYSF